MCMSVCITLQVRWTMDQMPAGKRHFPFLQNIQTALWSPPSGVSFPGITQLEPESNHSLLPGAEVKNEWSYASTPPIWHHDVDRNHLVYITDTWGSHCHECNDYCLQRCDTMQSCSLLIMCWTKLLAPLLPDCKVRHHRKYRSLLWKFLYSGDLFRLIPRESHQLHSRKFW